MTKTSEKYGFVYIWYDRKHKRYYIGCHWGTVTDGYICSSNWMLRAYNNRTEDFRRRIIKTNLSRMEMYQIEEHYLSMIKSTEMKPYNNKPRYYNLHTANKNPWHMHEESRQTVGEKISIAKKGKKNGPMTEERKRNISEAKKRKFEERQEKLGYKVAPETLAKQSAIRKGVAKHSDEWKQENSKRMKQRWSDGSRKRAEPRAKMTPEEKRANIQSRAAARWADPIWAENQRKKLRGGAKSRPPRSEESKEKASIAQKGKPKKRNPKATT